MRRNAVPSRRELWVETTILFNENAKYLNIYLVQNSKIFNENMKIFKKYFNCQVKNGNVFDKNTKTFKNIKTYSKIFNEIKVKNCYWEQRNLDIPEQKSIKLLPK